MSIQQSIVGLENNFKGKASVLSRTISRDNEISADETGLLILGTNFNMRSVRVHTRAPSEREIPTTFISDLIQAELARAIGAEANITREVSIGAMFTDDLPINGHPYANIYIVVNWAMAIDIPLPRDAHVNVEMYFGWRKTGRNIAIADNWHMKVDVSNVGPLRRRKVRESVIQRLDTGRADSSGNRIRDGLRAFFDIDNISDWYAIPGSGRHDTTETDIEPREDASFWVVQ